MHHFPGRNGLLFLSALATWSAAGCDEPRQGGAATGGSVSGAPLAPKPSPSMEPAATNTPPTGAPETEKPKPPERVAAQHVLITYRGAKNAPSKTKRTKAEARTLAEEVRRKAEGGAVFADLVAEYSEDPASKERMGSLGVFTPEKMVKPFSDAAFALKVNGVSPVVETEFGFHVIKRNQ